MLRNPLRRSWLTTTGAHGGIRCDLAVAGLRLTAAWPQSRRGLEDAAQLPASGGREARGPALPFPDERFMKLRVVVVDDHTMIREALTGLFTRTHDMEVVGSATTGAEGLRAARELAPDVVVMDVTMPDLNGIEATRAIRERNPAIAVVMLSMHSNREHIARAFAAGAAGYVLKDAASAEVVLAVRSVAAGHRYLSRGLEPSLAQFDSPASPLASLSTRERQVLQLVVEGRSSAEIARSVHLSPKTVETYRSRLMKKLGVSDVAALVKFAVQHGITTLD